MEQLIYKTTDFEGPLDLMLKLISKNKLNIYDIEISSLLDQFLEQINLLKQQKIDLASSFLEMAAKLVYIKTAQLLPKFKEKAEELKEEIKSQLIEYNEYKKVAEILINNLNQDFFCRKPMKINLDLTYKGIHSISEISRTYIDLIKNIMSKKLTETKEGKERLNKIVQNKSISVFSKVIHILRTLYKTGEFIFEDLFCNKEDRNDLIAFFLAILELIKCNKIFIDENSKKVVPSEKCLIKWKKCK